MRVHARQFVIGPEPLEPLASVRLGDVWLSRDTALPWEGEHLGVALGDDPDRSPGRFVRFDGERIELDACGTLGCFYRRTEGRIWASSSLPLLRSISPGLEPPQARLEWNGPLETVPPPLSGVEGISRLLPSQALNVVTGAVERRPLVVGAPRAYDESLDEIEEIVRSAVRAAGDGGSVWLPLTAGGDSRLILAACVAERVPVVTYTMRSSRIDEWDLRLPPRIAAAAGVEHRLIEPEPFNADVAAAFAEHTDGLTVDMDSEFVPRGQWERVPRDAIVLGGNVWEVGRCYYHSHQPDVPDEWLSWPTEPSVDWRDRLYIEQRIGGWLASFEEGVDFTEHTRVHVANSRRLVSLLLGLPEHLRRDGIHQRELTRRMAPRLAAFPVNRPSSVRLRAQRRLERELELVRYHGSIRRYTRARVGRVLGRA